MTLETLRWANGSLEMIDQRVLPASFAYLSFSSAASVADGIRSMVVRGAPAIGVAAAYGIALESLRLRATTSSDFRAGLEAGFTILAESRPTAINLFWALERMRRVWLAMPDQDNMAVAQRFLAEAHEILAEDVRINRAMGKHGAALLSDGARVLTHCNAGALATAGWGTALGFALKRAGRYSPCPCSGWNGQ